MAKYTCKATLNIKGEHFPCQQMEQMAPESDNHDGWAHSNRDAEAIWLSDRDLGRIARTDPPVTKPAPSAAAAERLAEVAIPFTLHMPTNRQDNPDGADLNSGANYVDVQVILDPAMEGRGECRNGYAGPVIALREWDEQVFLHELLHAATGYSQPLISTTYPPHGHEVISRIEVALWETGWRFAPVVDQIAEARVAEALRPVRELADEWTTATCQTDGAPCSWHRVSAECAAELRAVLPDPADTGSGL